MAYYYNKSQTPIPLTLAANHAVSVPPRSKLWLEGEQESSPALLRAIQAGQMTKLPDTYSQRQLATAASSSVPAVAPVVAAPAAPAAPVAAIPVAVIPPASPPRVIPAAAKVEPVVIPAPPVESEGVAPVELSVTGDELLFNTNKTRIKK